MIHLEIDKLREQRPDVKRFVLKANEPITLSFVQSNGHAVLYVYEGMLAQDDHETEPVTCYDSAEWSDLVDFRKE